MPRIDTAYKPLRARRRADTASALTDLFAEMKPDVLARYESGAKRLIAARWDEALAVVVLDQNMATASEVAARVAKALGAEFDPVVMTNWLQANAAIAGGNINAGAEDDIAEAGDAEDVDDPVGHVFGILATSGAAGLAARMVATAAGFGARDAARASGAAVKSWQVNSGNPRSAHAAMNGETVGIDESFSNGMSWPGDPAGGAENNAYCECSITIVG